MNRRTVLTLSATATFAALAGCTSPGRYRLGLQEQDPDELPNIIVTALPEHTRVDISSDTQSDEVPITALARRKPTRLRVWMKPTTGNLSTGLSYPGVL